MIGFAVVAASQSVAGRMNYTDQLGLITLVFYGQKGGARGALGVGLGPEKLREMAKKDHNSVKGEQQAVVNIRYMDADSPELAGRK